MFSSHLPRLSNTTLNAIRISLMHANARFISSSLIWWSQ